MTKALLVARGGFIPDENRIPSSVQRTALAGLSGLGVSASPEFVPSTGPRQLPVSRPHGPKNTGRGQTQ